MKTEITFPKPGRPHPNRIRFEGILTIVDTPSDKAPAGSRGHRVVLTRQAAEEGLWTLLGMAVDFKDGWDGHNVKQKCGIIDAAELKDDRLFVYGYLFSRDYDGLVRDLRRADRPLGMSYELADAVVEDMRAEIWRLTKASFIGAAILYADKAAYALTTFSIAACDEPFTGRISFMEADEVTGEVTLT